MIIQHNIMALNSYRQLNGNNSALAKNLEKLSSGYKVNRAGDDAAGLAISEKMRAQIKGLETASKNALDGISVIQTAEGSLTETHSMLNRMVELATQAANGIYSDEERSNIQSEIKSLNDEIDRIARNTDFNGLKLLNGSLGGGRATLEAKFGAAANSGVALKVSVGAAFGTGNISMAGKTAVTDNSANYLDKITAPDPATVASLTKTASGGEIGVKISGASAADPTLDIELKDGSSYSTDEINAAVRSTAQALLEKQVTNATTGNTEYAVGDQAARDALEALLSFDIADGSKATIAAVNGQSLYTGATFATATGGSVAKELGNPLVLQVGDTAEQTLSVSVDSMSAYSIGTSTVSVMSVDSSNAAIATIKGAISKVSTQRANLGALQNRLEHTINNLGVTTENITAAESRIRDTDVAKEMMAYTKNNILVQSAQAMLAQANQVPQGVLQLLR